MENIFSCTTQSIFENFANECNAIEAHGLCENIINDLFELHDLTQDYSHEFRKKYNLLKAFSNMYLNFEIQNRLVIA